MLPDEHPGAVEARLDAAVTHGHDGGNLVVGLVKEPAEPVDSLILGPELCDGVLLDVDELAQFARIVADSCLFEHLGSRRILVESAQECAPPQVVDAQAESDGDGYGIDGLRMEGLHAEQPNEHLLNHILAVGLGHAHLSEDGEQLRPHLDIGIGDGL